MVESAESAIELAQTWQPECEPCELYHIVLASILSRKPHSKSVARLVHRELTGVRMAILASAPYKCAVPVESLFKIIQLPEMGRCVRLKLPSCGVHGAVVVDGETGGETGAQRLDH